MAKKANLTTAEQKLIQKQMDQFLPTASRMMEVSCQMARAAHRTPKLSRRSPKSDFDFGESHQSE